MSGVKHTLGPWITFQPRGDGSVPVRTDGLGLTICYVHDGAICDAIANARLIAAAPDHHAVALELDRLALVIDSAVRFADPAFKDEVQALLKANKTALARARGEQSPTQSGKEVGNG